MKKTLRDFLGEQCGVVKVCRNDYEYYVRETGTMTEFMSKLDEEDLAILDYKANSVIILNGEKYDIRRQPITKDDTMEKHMKTYGYEKVPEEALDKYVGII